MTRFYKSGNSKSYRHKKGGFRGKPKKTQEKYKDTKGFWEYSDFQKIHDVLQEAKIKKELGFVGGFNPKKIDDMLNPPLTKEQVIANKLANNEKITSGEKIIYEHIKSKEVEALQKDKDNLKKYALKAIVTTDEGRTRKLLISLDHVLSKNNKDVICLIYLKLKDPQFELSDSLKKEFSSLLNRLEHYVSKCDLIQMQMTSLHSSQPPLDAKGFTKLDDFQVSVIENINNGVSTIVSAPTSAGKSVVSGYCFTKGKVLVIVPTDVLAWQMSAYMEDVVKTPVPIITKSFQSSPKRDELVTMVNSANALVGTADSILDFLPYINLQFDWIVFDEIHMIGKPEGSSMEHIARLFSNVPFLALSATIENVEGLRDWFQSLGDKPIDIVRCDKRFFNLQRYVWDSEEHDVKRIHPLSMVEVNEFEDGSIIKKNLNPTPPDIWDLAIKLEKKLDLGDIKPHSFFDQEERITLDRSNQYFSELIKFMVDNYSGKNARTINKIIESYQDIEFSKNHGEMLDLLLKLKEIKKCPAIIFQENSTSCMRLVRQFAKDIETAENEKYPNLVNDREKNNKEAKKLEKKNEKNKIEELGEKKRIKLLMQEGEPGNNTKGPKIEHFEYKSIQEPHSDFIFNDEQLFTSAVVDNWAKDLSKYFPNSFGEYHWLIIMLWRGVGVYVKGLPDPYLRLVQSLASAKKLAVVFSDSSLVFGVSMPFRTTVIFRDVMIEDTLDSMMYHQMAGRAGRRGLDKEGNVIFANYSWDRIKELSISSFPVVEGMDTMVYSVDMAKKISKNPIINWDNIKKNFLHSQISNTVAKEFYDDIAENCDEDGGWEFMNKDCNDFNHMVWKLRNDMDCVTIPLIIPEMKKIFDHVDPNREKDQIEIALFLSHFINLEEATDSDKILPKSDYLTKGTAKELKNACENLGIDIPENICSKVFESITYNKLIDQPNESMTDKLRDQLFKFSGKVRHIQHYFFHTKQITITRLIGKLLTRIWWIYHTSSPLMKSWKHYEEEIDMNALLAKDDEESDDDEEYESDSDEEDEEED